MKAYSKLGISVLSTLLDISGYRPGKWLMCPLWVKVKLHTPVRLMARTPPFQGGNEEFKSPTGDLGLEVKIC